ncbi:porin family protein [bacterium]|nr:porin family protein [bacterium]
MKSLCLVIGVVMLFFMPLSALAQSPHVGQVGFGGHLARWEPQDLEDTIFYGLQLRFRLSDTFAVEGSIDYYQEEYDNDVEMVIYPVQATLLIYLIPSRILELYLNAGAGWYHYDYDTPVIKDDGHEFGWHGGAGVELPLTEYIAFYGDLRWVYFKPEIEASDIEDWNGLWADVGFLVYF